MFWVATDPNAVTITAPENFSGQVDFSVTPIVTEDDGDTLESAEQQVSFQDHAVAGGRVQHPVQSGRGSTGAA